MIDQNLIIVKEAIKLIVDRSKLLPNFTTALPTVYSCILGKKTRRVETPAFETNFGMYFDRNFVYARWSLWKSFSYLSLRISKIWSNISICLFSVGESSGKASRSVANRIPGPNTEGIRERVGTATSEVSWIVNIHIFL